MINVENRIRSSCEVENSIQMIIVWFKVHKQRDCHCNLDEEENVQVEFPESEREEVTCIS